MAGDEDAVPSPFGPLKPGKRQKAVALEYDKEKAPAPRIVASGDGKLAEQILAIAFAHGIKVREDADLVEILSVMEVDSVIPVEAFAAVGEILTYVYQANGKAAEMKKKAGSARKVGTQAETKKME